MGRIIPYIMENKNVPNHQPDNQSTKVFLISSTRKLGQPDDELKLWSLPSSVIACCIFLGKLYFTNLNWGHLGMISLSNHDYWGKGSLRYPPWPNFPCFCSAGLLKPWPIGIAKNATAQPARTHQWPRDRKADHGEALPRALCQKASGLAAIDGLSHMHLSLHCN